MNKREIRKKIREAKRQMKLYSEVFQEILRENPNATDFSRAYEHLDETKRITEEVFESIPHERDVDLEGFIPYRIVGDYLVFASMSAGYRSMMGWTSGSKDFIAVHLKTGKIRKESFAYSGEPYGWWMKLLKADDGTCTEEEWQEIMRQDSLRRLIEKVA